MEDPITEAPPPSRFFTEDLNNFTQPSPPLPSPFLTLSSTPNPNPSLLIISISSSSLHLLHHHIPSKTLIGTLILPELPFSPTPISSSPSSSKSINLYSLSSPPPILFLSVQIPIPENRSHAVAKLLLEKIRPGKVLILDSVQSRNFRGRLAPDECLGFKLETMEERERTKDGDKMAKGLDLFPSGSMIEGFGAAVLSRCEMKRIRGSLVVTWPEFGGDVLGMVKGLIETAAREVAFGFGEGDLGFNRRDSRFDSDLYT